MTHDRYADAYAEARARATSTGREHGIERVREYGRERFAVHALPAPERRQGFELRVEVVGPDAPRTAPAAGLCGLCAGTGAIDCLVGWYDPRRPYARDIARRVPCPCRSGRR